MEIPAGGKISVKALSEGFQFGALKTGALGNAPEGYEWVRGAHRLIGAV